MTVLGHWVLILALMTSAASALFYFRAATMRGAAAGPPRVLLRIGSALVAVASAILTILLLQHDFTNGYVYGYSDRSLPLFYLLSCFYAGQEGSFLFWVLCSALIAVVLSASTRKRGAEPEILAVFMAVQTILILLTVARSPFRSIWEMYPGAPAGQIPADGRGLNPLLQNFWMVIHPPVLFLGFALMAAPFSQAVAALWRRSYRILVEQGLAWTLLAVSVLGLGIMLGAYWAYGVLGWGGYWGWDPVENSSLIPWLTGIALVHTLLAQRRTGRFQKTNFALAIVSYLLVVYSTFLTRSGILGDASVHAFTDSGAEVYWLLLAFLAAIAVTGTWLLAQRARDLAHSGEGTGWWTRELLLAAGAITLLLSAAVILFGTSLPIFSTTRVEPSFYDATNLPLAILMAALIGFSLYATWEEQDLRASAARSWKAIVAALLITVILAVAGMRDPGTTALAFTAFFALLVNIDVGITIVRGDPLFLGGKIAHIGLALFFLGVVATGKYSSTQHAVLPKGTPVEVLGHTLTYEGFTISPDQKYSFQVTAAEAGTRFTLSPVMFDAGQQGIMRNPDIVSFLTRDFYLSPVSLEPPTEVPAGKEYTLEKGVPVAIEGVTVTFQRFAMGEHAGSTMMGGSGPLSVGAVLHVEGEGQKQVVQPVVEYSQEGTPRNTSVPSSLLHGNVRLVSVNAGMGQGPSTVTIAIEGEATHSGRPEALVVEASVKPYINLLWVGTVVMMLGFFLAIVKRQRERS